MADAASDRAVYFKLWRHIEDLFGHDDNKAKFDKAMMLAKNNRGEHLISDPISWRDRKARFLGEIHEVLLSIPLDIPDSHWIVSTALSNFSTLTDWKDNEAMVIRMEAHQLWLTKRDGTEIAVYGNSRLNNKISTLKKKISTLPNESDSKPLLEKIKAAKKNEKSALGVAQQAEKDDLKTMLESKLRATGKERAEKTLETYYAVDALRYKAQLAFEAYGAFITNPFLYFTSKFVESRYLIMVDTMEYRQGPINKLASSKSTLAQEVERALQVKKRRESAEWSLGIVSREIKARAKIDRTNYYVKDSEDLITFVEKQKPWFENQYKTAIQKSKKYSKKEIVARKLKAYVKVNKDLSIEIDKINTLYLQSLPAMESERGPEKA